MSRRKKERILDPINPLGLNFATGVPNLMATHAACAHDPDMLEGPYRVIRAPRDGFLPCAFGGAVGWRVKEGDPIIEITPGKLVVADPAHAAFYFPIS